MTIASVYSKARAEHGVNRRENKTLNEKKFAIPATFATKDTEKYPPAENETDITTNQHVTPELPYVNQALFNTARPCCGTWYAPASKDASGIWQSSPHWL